MERIQSAKVTFKVIQGHWHWGHSCTKFDYSSFSRFRGMVGVHHVT